MNTNKNVIALFAIFTQMLVMTVAFAESSEKKQTGILKPVNKMSILMQTKANGLNTTKVPVVKAKPHKAIVAQTKSKTNSEPRPGSNSIVSPHSPRPGNEQWGGGAGGEEITLPIRAPVAKAKTRKSPVLQSKRFPERPSYLRSDNKMDKQPVVSSSQKMQNSLQKNKVTSIKAKPNKAGASQVKPLLVNRLGKSHAKGPTNAVALNPPISLQENGINFPDEHIKQADQAREINEMSEVVRDNLGVLNQENPLDFKLGLGGNGSDGLSFGGNGNSNNDPVRGAGPLGTVSVRDVAAGATSSLYTAPPNASRSENESSDGGTSEIYRWTGAGNRGSKTLVNDYHSDGSFTQTFDVRNADGSSTVTYIDVDRDGNETNRVVTTSTGNENADDSVEDTVEPEVTAEVENTIDPNSDPSSGQWPDVEETMTWIKKDTSVKTHKYVNPGKQEETVSNDAPTVSLSISTDQLVTNPDPENSRGDAVAGRAMRPEKIMEGVGPGGHIGKGQ